MAAITSPPTPALLATYSAAYAPSQLNQQQRLALLIQAKIVLLKYKGGTNYVGNHAQLMQDAITAFAGLTPEAWSVFASDADVDPGAVVVGFFITQANFRDSVNMPSLLATQLTLLGAQLARPRIQLQKQNVYLDYKLLALWA